MPSNPLFQRIDNPFTNIPWEELKSFFEQTGSTNREELQKTLKSIEKLVEHINPLYLLSALSTYGLFGAITTTGQINPINSKMQQALVEFTQALSLKLFKTNSESQIPSPQDIQKVWDFLPKVSEAFILSRLGQIKSCQNPKERTILRLQEKIRIHSQGIRNWGHFDQVITISKELYRPIDHHFLKNIGLKATTIIDCFIFIIKRIESSTNDHFDKIAPIFQKTSIEDVAHAYHEAFPEFQGSPEELEEQFDSLNLDINQAFSLILSHSHLMVIKFFIFELNQIPTEIISEPTEKKASFDLLSHEFGELSEVSSESFFLNNPVWLKPLIKIGPEKYFCPLPQLFFSFIFECLDNLVINNSNIYQKTIPKRRSEYLETKIQQLFENSFPQVDCIKNFIWRDNGTQYETDLIAKIDSHLIIVEAKSGTVSWSALRGAPKRTEKHIKDLFIDPAIQSQRLKTKLTEEIKNGSLSSDLTNFPFLLEEIHKIIRISVTLSDFATIQANLGDLRGTDWFEKDLELPPTISLSDLEVVLELLPSPSHKLHYFSRRQFLENHKNYLADEMDLLGTYFKSGLSFGDSDYNSDLLFLTGMSKEIDDYYIARAHDVEKEKPKLKLTNFWEDILATIFEKNFKRWSEVALILLNISFEKQNEIQDAFDKITQNYKAEGIYDLDNMAIILKPNNYSEESVAFMAFTNAYDIQRHDFSETIAKKAFENLKAKVCVVIGINLDEEHYPYSLLTVFDSK